MRHQFVDRRSGGVIDEALFGDAIVRFLYSTARERAPWLLRAATSARATELLALLQFDWPLAPHLLGSRRLLRRLGVDLAECLDDPATLATPRALFERRIRYWEHRPMAEEARQVVSPCDSRALPGSLAEGAPLWLKGKLFEAEELLGRREHWCHRFAGGDFAVLRLTPEKYHYNHTPVAGKVLDLYELAGSYHSCHPAATVELATPLSKNRRTVTVFDTDVPGGTGVGWVAMVEVAALLIGETVQAYSARRYDDPAPLGVGAFAEKGRPKSLFRPGSSTVVLLFERNRVCFEPDLVAHRLRADVRSLLSAGFGVPAVEVDVLVRSPLARARAVNEEVEAGGDSLGSLGERLRRSHSPSRVSAGGGIPKREGP